MAQTKVLGFPRIGEKRELKKATESYWKGDISRDELLKAAKDLRQQNWTYQKEVGIDFIPSNDFSFYDQTLDMSCLLGVIPDRFGWDGGNVDLDLQFLVARGQIKRQIASHLKSAPAGEMTKWFDTNYHYIVPEFNASTKFKLSSNKVFEEYQEAKALGIETTPVLIGPVTYLLLGKTTDGSNQLNLLDPLLDSYEQILAKLKELGAEWVQLDEPYFAMDLNEEQKNALKKAYARLTALTNRPKIFLASYFGELRDNRDIFNSIQTEGKHIDANRGAADIEAVAGSLSDNQFLSVGIVNGRNIWKNNFDGSLATLNSIKSKLGNRLVVGTSCSLMHSPVSLRHETAMDSEIKNWLAFAEEKVVEVKILSDLVSGIERSAELHENQAAISSRKTSKTIHNDAVKSRVSQIKSSDYERSSVYATRRTAQQKELNLPLYPTTTIGSFPQTTQVRQARAQFKSGEISQEQYDDFIAKETKLAIDFQDEIDMDMYVHGEFERNDMVEYFGEKLDGFVFSQFGWVQSYGSRYVKPPIIFGDVSRPEAMTVKWSSYAQSLTDKPMKGMLTGPVTILQWSFVRDDQPRSETTFQIALALRDEVVDLEKAGIAAIQIDEPALREGLPLRKSDWKAYLEWAVNSFKLSAAGVQDKTQIHTHMCYCEFNDIIEAIAALDADVISMETSRSNMELLEVFKNYNYPNEIGPGVYDIHSPRIPSKEEMVDLLTKARNVLSDEQLWVNPDCGLKTRGWEEVKPALLNMVDSAKEMRVKVAQPA